VHCTLTLGSPKGLLRLELDATAQSLVHVVGKDLIKTTAGVERSLGVAAENAVFGRFCGLD
jgi:hypothetical protein